MKKTCFALLCALLLGLAPATAADEGGLFDNLADLVAHWIASAAGDAIGPEFPPNGQSASDESLPPKSSPAIGDEPEIGPQYPPHG